MLLCGGAGRATAQRLPERTSIGTGFAVSSDGTIVTTAHEVDGCRSVRVGRRDAAPLAAKDIRLDRAADLALLRVKLSRELTPLPVRSDPAPVLGEPVYLLGYPFQRVLGGRSSFLATVVGGLGGIHGDPQVFRLPAVVLPGMSGAAVLDAHGRAIGVVKTHLVETMPGRGPTLGGESFAILGTLLAKFALGDRPVEATGSGPSLSSAAIAERALAGSVLITCQR